MAHTQYKNKLDLSLLTLFVNLPHLRRLADHPKPFATHASHVTSLSKRVAASGDNKLRAAGSPKPVEAWRWSAVEAVRSIGEQVSCTASRFEIYAQRPKVMISCAYLAGLQFAILGHQNHCCKIQSNPKIARGTVSPHGTDHWAMHPCICTRNPSVCTVMVRANVLLRQRHPRYLVRKGGQARTGFAMAL